ncbi:MAG: AlkZ family DNA glycosylase [Oscillospiraceae bacterium]|nr:AlkZ family DNA glycosylase [Oscillospiraceae bacterium]
MERDEIIARRMAGQHLLQKSSTQTVVKDLCGVQAQFLSHALHGLSIRCTEVCTDNLVKSWTNRGTMHLFCEDDLPLFLHQGRMHFLRPVDTLVSDGYMNAERKAYFADVIINGIVQGIDQREELKVLCESHGMTETEASSAFDPWGGLIRALCESGRICHKVQEKKAYVLCPLFVPMEELPARLELARRYFTYFGPATIKDAAYFFGTTQTQVKAWLKALPVEETQLGGKTYFYIDSAAKISAMPDCLFLAGFDQFLLGYEKTESLSLPQEYMRSIFTLAGIVRPAVLLNGQVAGWWNLKNRNLKITLFSPADRRMIENAAMQQWEDLKSISFM